MSDSTIDTVRLDSETKLRLSTLKRRTGIENWNTLCRWAFCLSLVDDTPVRDREEQGVGAVEMSWKTFAGEDEGVYALLLRDRCTADYGCADRETLSRCLRKHIARGTARLVANRSIKTLSDLINLATA